MLTTIMRGPRAVGGSTKVSLSVSDWLKFLGALLAATFSIVVFIKDLQYDVKAASAQASLASDKAEQAIERAESVREDLDGNLKQLIRQVGELNGYVKAIAETQKGK